MHDTHTQADEIVARWGATPIDRDPPEGVRSLQDFATLIGTRRNARTAAAALVVRAIHGVARALAEEFCAGHMVLRLHPGDLIYNAADECFAVGSEVTRYPVDQPAPHTTLLDTGLYAPELTGHLNRPLSPRTTVYNAAALLYYAVTGVDPVPELFSLGHRLPLVRVFEPTLPLGIDPILRRALSRHPDDRFSDPQALRVAIEEVLAIEDRRCSAASLDGARFRYATATHPGIQKSEKNPENQDRFYAAYDSALDLGLFVVADGVSTCDIGSGDRAAQHVIDAARAVWDDTRAELADRSVSTRPKDAELVVRLQRIVTRANEAIVVDANDAQDGPVHEQDRIMSSTVVAAFVTGRRVVIVSVGDSCVYLVRQEYVDRATVDMNRGTSTLLRGRGLDAIVNGSGLSQLTAAVGTSALDPQSHRRVPKPVSCQFVAFHVQAGETVLLCSDGVPDCIGDDSDARIQAIVSASKSPSKIAWDLLVAANEGGGKDNITAIVLACAAVEENHEERD